LTQLIWLSDLHFSASGPVFGIDTHARIVAAVDYINRHHATAAGCVISGDLVNRGGERDYAELARILAALRIPVFPMVGNHDNRELLREHFSLPANAMSDFVQYQWDVGDHSILCLDTQHEGSDAGAFCVTRADWLDATLSKTTRPTLIFMHHPPLPLGLPMQDRDRLQDGDAFLARLKRYAQVAYLFCGHVHRPISGVVEGIPFSTLRSALYQAPPPQPQWTWDTFSPAKEAPQLGVLTLSGSHVTIEFNEFCPSYGSPN